MNGNRKVEINRNMYQRIHKFDHSQLKLFCEDLYKNAYEDGKAAVSGVDFKKMEEAIRGTKGIGEKKATDIIAEVNKLFKEDK